MLRLKLLRLQKRMARGPGEPKRLLAPPQFQPKQEMAGVGLQGLLHEFHGQRELPVVKTDAAGQPGEKPMIRRERQRLFETEVRPRLLPGEEDLAAREPDVWGVAAFLDGGI